MFEFANSFGSKSPPSPSLHMPCPHLIPIPLPSSPHNNPAARNLSGRQTCSGSTPAGSLNATHCEFPATGRGLVKRLSRQAYGESTPAGSLNATHHKLPRGKPTTGRGFAKRLGRQQLFFSCDRQIHYIPPPSPSPSQYHHLILIPIMSSFSRSTRIKPFAAPSLAHVFPPWLASMASSDQY